MHRFEVKRQLDEGDIAAISGLLDEARAHDHHAPLGDHQWLDLVQGGRKGFAGLVAWRDDHNHPIAYAQVSRGPSSWALEVVVGPHHRNDDGYLAAQELLARALDVVAAEGGGHVHLWVPKPTAETDAMARAAGLARGRDLLQLRRPLPVDEHWTLDVRPFVVGRDEASWLEVNNRAFAWHPEQGDWDMDTLRSREREPWFDPEGFLLHERDGRLAGFCWTKIHTDHDPPLGEIYVIAVDPDYAGKGIGRALVLAGLDHLATRGISTGMLYVDADNAAAVGLYDDLGFERDHIDRAYTCDVAPSSAPSP